MNSSQTMAVPLGEYNTKWCERNPLVCSDDKRRERAFAASTGEDLTSSQRSAIYMHDLVCREGLEFVVFTNAHLDEPVELPGGITLVPCFVSLEDVQDLQEPAVQATVRMAQRGRLVYDGWLPIMDWEAEAVRRRTRQMVR